MTDHGPRLAPEVVVGVDGSPAVLGAVQYGLGVAVEVGAPLRLVHAVPTLGPVPPLGPAAPDRAYAVGSALLLDLTRRVRLAEPSLEVRTTLQQGAVVPVLVESARDAVLVVLGRRVSPDPGKLVAGHHATGRVVAGVTKRTPTPVTVVPGDWRPRSSYRDVVVGLEDPSVAPAVLIRGLEHARRSGGSLVILHAWQVPAGYEDLVPTSQAEAWSTELRERILRSTAAVRSSVPDVAVEVRVVQESPVDALLQASTQAAVVLVGRRSGVGHWAHLSSVPRALQRASRCPLEVGPIGVGTESVIDLELERDGVLLR